MTACGSPGRPSALPGGSVTRSAWPASCSATPGPPPLPKRSPGSWTLRQRRRHSSASTGSGGGGSPRSFSRGGRSPAAATCAAASSGSGPHWPRWTRRKPEGSARSRSGCWPRPSCWPGVRPKPARRCAWPDRRQAGWASTCTTRCCAPCKPGSAKRAPGLQHEQANRGSQWAGVFVRVGRHDRKLGQPRQPRTCRGRGRRTAPRPGSAPRPPAATLMLCSAAATPSPRSLRGSSTGRCSGPG